MIKVAALLSFSLIVAGCVQTGKFYRISDGLAADSTPAISQAFETDRVICDGEAAKAALGSTEKNRLDHNNAVNLVYRGCLAQKGWKFVQTSQ
jgi:hypothetical protein